MASWQYRYEAASVEGFVEQLVRYINTGHVFYVTGTIPAHKAAPTTAAPTAARSETGESSPPESYP